MVTAANGLTSERLRKCAPTVGTILAVCVASRMLCLLALYLRAHQLGLPLGTLVTKFDGAYYQIIATSGYPHVLPVNHGQVIKNPVAFFPLFPLLVKAVMWATGLGFASAAVLFNTIAAGIAALLIAKVVKQHSDERTANITAMLWLVWPIAFVLTLAYSEALFVAVAAGCLLSLFRKHWIAAGVLAALASAARPNGLILALCCAVAAVMAFKQDRKLQPFIAPFIAPIGTLAYFAWLWNRTGRATAWSTTESQGWQVYFDGGIHNAEKIGSYLHQGRADGLGVVLFTVVLAVLLVMLYVDKAHPILLVYATSIFVFAVTTRNDLSSVPRFLYSAFPLMMPIASRLRNVRWYWLVGLLASSTVIMAGLAVYITTRSHYPP